MTNLSDKALNYLRKLTGEFTTKPLGALVLINKEFKNSTVNYTVQVTITNRIILSNGTKSFSVIYLNKSIRQVAQELSNSPFPIDVIPLADIQKLASKELVVFAPKVIPTDFDIYDISNDGNGCIIRSIRYGIKYDSITAFDLKSPYRNNSLLPWFARITNGTFSQKYKNIVYYFGIPEYKDQLWSTTAGKPYIDVQGEQANFVNGSTIKLARSPIFYKNNILITNSSGEKVYSSSVIKHVDIINGYVYIDPSVDLPRDISVSYTYYEKSLIYKGINLNGHFSQNPYILNKYIVFYALPIKSSAGGHRSRSIYHAIGTSIADAIFSIKVDDPNEPLTVIGAVNVQSSLGADDISITDTRSFGGGLRDDEAGKATEKRFKESQYFFDIGRVEGIPYPGTAAIVVDIPSSLKEVLTLAQIRERASKFIAAGVYPVININNESYYNQFDVNEYNSDISFVNYGLAYSNPGYSESTYGLSGTAGGYLNINNALPTGLYTNQYSTTGSKICPTVQNGILKLSPGEKYKVSFIKGSADAVFSYEWKTKDGEWQLKTVNNFNTVSTGNLSCQSFDLDASYGYKEIRNITGLSPYILSQSFFDDCLLSSTRIIEYTQQQSNGYSLTGYTPDVFNFDLESSPITIGVPKALEPIFTNYDNLWRMNYYSEIQNSLLSGHVAVIYSGTLGNTFPLPYNYSNGSFASAYNGTYDALKDVHAYSRYVHGRINETVLSSSDNIQAVNFTGSSAWISLNPSNDITHAFSGANAIFNKVFSLSPFSNVTTVNNDIITPFYNPSLNTAISLSSSYSNGEVTENNNNLYLGCNYIKTAAAFYSSQTSPSTGVYNSDVSTRIPYNCRDLAISGMAIWNNNFNIYFSTPTYSGSYLLNSWVTTYNRISSFASSYLDAVCNAYDYIYYGNKAWAGWTGHEAKSPIYYDATNNPVTHLSGDMTWTGNIVWPDSQTFTAIQALNVLQNEIQSNIATLIPYIRTNAYNGGIMQKGIFKALKYLLWHPTNSLMGHDFITGSYPSHVETFEIGMGAALKGCLNENGIIIEGGSFNYQNAPFDAVLPNDMLDASFYAANYYNLANDTTNRNKWLAIAEGIYRTTEKLYALSGGYPYNPYFSVSASGDAGSSVLNGYLQVLTALDAPLTDDEFIYFVGSIDRVF